MLNIVFDSKLYDLIMSQPAGPSYKEIKRNASKYVTLISEESKKDILARSEQIEKQAEYDEEYTKEIYLKLGCTDEEASFLKDKRINSPGVRSFLKGRREGVELALRVKKKYEGRMDEVFGYYKRKIAQDPAHRESYKEQGDDALSDLKTRMNDEMELALYSNQNISIEDEKDDED